MSRPSRPPSSSTASASKPPPYITTDTGNLVSRACSISGSKNIVLAGKSILRHGCVVRGDLRRAGAAPGGAKEGGSVVIAIGRYCDVGEGVVLRPCYKTYKGCVASSPSPRPPPRVSLILLLTPSLFRRVFSFYPMKIGDHVSIGAGSVVEAASIGTGVEIGKGCIIVRPSGSLSSCVARLAPLVEKGGAATKLVAMEQPARRSLRSSLLTFPPLSRTLAGPARHPQGLQPHRRRRRRRERYDRPEPHRVGRQSRCVLLARLFPSLALLAPRADGFDLLDRLLRAARPVGQLPESTPELVETRAKTAYTRFQPE